MKIRTIAVSAAALAMTATPVLAQADVSEVSRSVEATSQDSQLEGDTAIIVGLLAAAAVIGAIILISDDDDDEPASP